MKKWYLIKLCEGDSIVSHGKKYHIPLTRYYLVKEYPVIYDKREGRNFEPYEMESGMFINTVTAWW